MSTFNAPPNRFFFVTLLFIKLEKKLVCPENLDINPLFIHSS